jgi:hypothetical protein
MFKLCLPRDFQISLTSHSPPPKRSLYLASTKMYENNGVPSFSHVSLGVMVYTGDCKYESEANSLCHPLHTHCTNS